MNNSVHSPDSSTPLEGDNSIENNSNSNLIRQNSFINNKKIHLQNLNDRFSSFIDRVRQLELENAHLHKEADRVHEFGINERNRVRSQCESELSDLRRNVDEASREKAKLEIDAKRLGDHHDNLLQKCDKNLSVLLETEGKNNELEGKYNNMIKKYNEIVSEVKKNTETAAKLQAEQNDLCNSTEESRKNLEEETLKRVDLENMVQSLNEEITFKESIFEQQRNDLSETQHQRELEFNDLATVLDHEYEKKLKHTLDKLKLQYEDDLRRKCDDMHIKYQNKLKKMQIEIQKSGNRKILEDLKVAKKQLNNLTERSEDLTASNEKLKVRLNKLNADIENEHKENANVTQQMEKDLRSMNEKSAQQLKEYTDLLDVKISLDLELSTYDKLLKVEESRLNITPTTPTSSKCLDSENISELNDSITLSRAANQEDLDIMNDYLLTDKNNKLIKTGFQESEKAIPRKRKRISVSKDKENIEEINKQNDNSNGTNVNNPTKKKSFFKF